MTPGCTNELGDRRRQRAERARRRGAVGPRRPRRDRARGQRHDRWRDTQLGDDRPRSRARSLLGIPSDRRRVAVPDWVGPRLGWPDLAAAVGRLCPSARRRISRRAVPIDRADRGRDGRGRRAMASGLCADGHSVRRLVRRRLPTGPARAATPVDAGALRHRRDVAGHRAGRALEDGGGQVAVGRRRGAYQLSPRPSDDQRDRADADRRRTRQGVGGGGRRLTGDRQRLGGRHRTPRRQDRDRSTCDLTR